MFHVKQNSELSNLGEFLLSTDLEFDDQMMRQLTVYMQLISLWSKKINLVSKEDTKNLVKKHLIPCLWFSEIIKKEKVNTLLDIGSGAGFPGIVIKIINPNLNVALIDSIRKKTLFLKEVANEINISVDIKAQRIEEYNLHTTNNYDATVCRAVGKIKSLWQWSYPILKKGGALYAMKGDNYQDEILGLSEFNVKTKEINPDKKWAQASMGINDKIIIKVERNNERK